MTTGSPRERAGRAKEPRQGVAVGCNFCHARLAGFLVATVSLSLAATRGSARAAPCPSTCTAQLAECKRTCPEGSQAPRDCREACAERSTCTAPGRAHPHAGLRSGGMHPRPAGAILPETEAPRPARELRPDDGHGDGEQVGGSKGVIAFRPYQPSRPAAVPAPAFRFRLDRGTATVYRRCVNRRLADFAFGSSLGPELRPRKRSSYGARASALSRFSLPLPPPNICQSRRL